MFAAADLSHLYDMGTDGQILDPVPGVSRHGNDPLDSKSVTVDPASPDTGDTVTVTGSPGKLFDAGSGTIGDGNSNGSGSITLSTWLARETSPASNWTSEGSPAFPPCDASILRIRPPPG